MIRFTKAKGTPRRPPKPKPDKNAALNKLRSFLTAAEPETVEIVVSCLQGQTNAITYKELRECYLAGGITDKQFTQWQKDYSQLITSTLAPQWQKAAEAGAQQVKDQYPYFVYEPAVSAGMDFIKQHGAELVTNLAVEQREALNAVIAHVSGYTAVTPDEAARIIRPCVGLTKPQALANARYREAVKQAFLKANPRSRESTAEKKAAEAAARYAARQHRYRAQNIARTELAYAYNAGHYGATKDAQAQGYIGDCVKVWLTAFDERVCPLCSAMDEEKKNMDEMFSNGKMLPPGHPSCRCAVAYEEIPGTMLTSSTPDSTINRTGNEEESEFTVDDLHPAVLGGVARGEPMTFDEADTYKVNPNYGTDDGYSINCQSCVVAFEARQRGYDVSVLPNTQGSALEKLSYNTRLAWIDPATGKPPGLIYDVYADTPGKAVKFIKKTIQQGERYTLQFAWKGRNAGGHIVNIDLTPSGELRMKDNQRGIGERSEWIGDTEVREYLKQIKFQKKANGKIYYTGPLLIRIDDKAFNEAIVNDILKG